MWRRYAFPLPVLPVLPLACFSPGDPATLTFDGATLPSLDLPDAAALPDVVLFSNTPPVVDAGPPDAPAPLPVKVTVVSDLGPEAGVSLVVSDVAGNILSMAITDATGSAEIPVASGASITAVLGQSPFEFVTYMGVEPGDALTVIDTTQAIGQYEQGLVSVNVTGLPDSFGSAEGDVVVGNCDSGFGEGLPLSGPQLNLGCYLGGVFPLLLLQTGGETNGYVVQNGNSLGPTLLGLADGGTSVVNVDLSNATLNLDQGSQAVTAINLPPVAATSQIGISFSEIASGVLGTQHAYVDATGTGDAGSASYSFDTHPSYPDFVQSEVDLFAGQDSTVGPYWSIVRRTDTASGSETLDFSNLPSLVPSADYLVTASNVSIAWTTTAPVPSSVGTMVGLFWNSGSWFFVVPPGTTRIASPTLPPSLVSALPQDNPVRNVALLSGDGLADYAALKKVAYTMMNVGYGEANTFNWLTAPALPLDGDMTITGFYEGS